MNRNDCLGDASLSPTCSLRILPRLPQRPSVPLFLVIALGVFFFGYQNSVSAGLTILHSFGDGSVTNDGAYPSAGLIRVSGNFYGVTARQAQSPSSQDGTVFEMTSADKLSVIYSFPSNSFLFSNAPLLLYHGKLIGVTPFGPGSTGTGTLFALRQIPSTGQWRSSFWQQNLGPAGNVILGSDSFFYGVVGGFPGSVYKVDPKTHQLTTVYSFSIAGNYIPGPGLVEGSDGNFYGTTNRVAGLQYQWGAIFKLTPGGQATFSQFGGLEGTGPMIKASDSNLYGLGATFNDIGTESSGFVYSLSSTGSINVLHSFGQGTDGYFPVGSLVQGPNGNLYGVTGQGGTAGFGVIFEISTNSSTYTILHNFGDGSVANDGKDPVGPLVVGKDKNLYGTTTAGGSAGLGTVFKITP